ncbi:uncharacterized protein LOC122030458 [Zingiber officinale]|uniref:Uncharacterized protein n=1 Tax=Zingiber officinale TaxID=94328 RepID=A0A8J5I6M0_ZINOF|nr:uncharacterized protein LOC122030458 [Zingiber officinale]KAG6537114.1 hypothetical protein ZIOFF_002196 [Zingiber officinale]
MASLTPGVLLKLLQSMNTDARVVGEHRSAVLQIIGIVPALSVPTGGSFLPSHGFYLQLSDSANSTYVSLSDADADAVLSSRPQLGQLVHVDRLQFAHPAPRAVGLRPVPGARPHPFVGSPDPLIALSSPGNRGFVIQPATAADAGPPLFPSFFGANQSHQVEKRFVFASKENVVVGLGKNQGDCSGKTTRFSSPVTEKLSVVKSGAVSADTKVELSREPSPALKANLRHSSPAMAARANSRQSSPIPSKCEVPSLVAAKEENRRSVREPAIVVPSRYRQPSPAGRKSSASQIKRRSSVSPARRLSIGLKVPSPATGDGSEKKKFGVVVAGIAMGSDALIGSAKSTRKSWDDSTMTSLVLPSEPKEKGGSKRKMDKESILRTQVAISRRLSDAETMEISAMELCSMQTPRATNKSDSSTSSEKSSNMATGITLHDKKWTDGSISFDSIPDHLARLGKEAFQRRNVASIAAADALEEALVAESLIRNLSMFSELCSLSQANNPVPTINRFLSTYDDVLRCKAVAKSLSASRNDDGLKDATPTEQGRLASLWVQAALATDLKAIHLLNTDTECPLNQKASEKLASPQVDHPQRKNVPKKHSSTRKCHSKGLSIASIGTWTHGDGAHEAVDFANMFKYEMQAWFLKFVEEAIEAGFRLFGENSDDNRVAAVLSQLKRINDWLDGVGKTSEGEVLKEKIERLKCKIYGFVIGHLELAFDTTISLAKA